MFHLLHISVQTQTQSLDTHIKIPTNASHRDAYMGSLM